MTNESREPSVDEKPIAKRLILGDPLASTDSDEHLLPKKLALPIFASDALSSVAYAPQELLLILLTGGPRSSRSPPGSRQPSSCC